MVYPPHHLIRIRNVQLVLFIQNPHHCAEELEEVLLSATEVGLHVHVDLIHHLGVRTEIDTEAVEHLGLDLVVRLPRPARRHFVSL